MPVRSRPNADATPSEPSTDDECPVSALESRPGKLVFVEEGNADGWIATEHVVALRE